MLDFQTEKKRVNRSNIKKKEISAQVAKRELNFSAML